MRFTAFTVLLAAAFAVALPTPLENAALEARDQCLSEGTRCYGTFLTCCAPYRCQYIPAINTGVRTHDSLACPTKSNFTLSCAVLHTLNVRSLTCQRSGTRRFHDNRWHWRIARRTKELFMKICIRGCTVGYVDGYVYHHQSHSRTNHDMKPFEIKRT